VDLPQEVCDRLFKQSQSISLEDIFTAFNILIATQEMTKRLDSQRIPLEISLVRLAHDKTAVNGLASSGQSQRTKIEAKIVPVITKIVPEKIVEKISEKSENSKIAKQETIKEDLAGVVVVTLENVKSVWSNIINNVSKIKMSVSSYLSEGEPIKIQGNLITIALPKSCSLHKESLEKKEHKDMIEKTASELCNADLKVNFILTAQMRQESDTRSNPFVKSAIEMFGGRVIKEE
jgi:hypothetical protein